MISAAQKQKLDEQISAAFRSGAARRSGESQAAFLKRNSAAARKVISLTRKLGLERQRMADAKPWKAPAGIQLNAFAKRVAAGLIGDTLGRAKPTVTKIKRAKPAVICQHCGKVAA